MITGHQLRDARRLIGWTVLTKARVSKVSRATLSDSGARALVRTFEAAGIEFTAEDGEGMRCVRGRNHLKKASNSRFEPKLVLFAEKKVHGSERAQQEF